MTDTPLDTAHAAMQAAPGSDAARLRFHERLADAELFLLLAAEPDGDSIEPQVFDVDDDRFVLVFDREHRLAAFTGQPAPYAALSGRVVAQMLAEQGIGLGLNLDVAPSSILIPASAVAWLHETLGHRPTRIDAHPIAIDAPRGLPEDLLTALDAKLATASGLARSAYLVAVTYAPARPGHLLAFIDPVPGAEPALARATGEALTFSGIEAGELDVGFFSATDPMAARLAKAGLRFDLPAPDPAAAPAAPGTDPGRPPILR